MKKGKYIKASNLPPAFRFPSLIAYWLLLEHFHVPDWAYGVFYTLAVITLLANLFILIVRDPVDLLDGAND